MNTGTLSAAVDRASEQALREALELGNGSPTQAARLLGVTRQTVYRLMRRFGVEIEVKRRVKPAA